jgi:hypothetical protein
MALTMPDLAAGVLLMSGRVPDALKPQIAPAARLAISRFW